MRQNLQLISLKRIELRKVGEKVPQVQACVFQGKSQFLLLIFQLGRCKLVNKKLCMFQYF